MRSQTYLRSVGLGNLLSLALAALLAGASAAGAAGVEGGCISEVGGLNNPSCTANDVSLTDIVPGSLQVVGGGCTGSPSDTVTFTAQGVFTLTTQTRYDLGIYIATDGDPDGKGARTGTCFRDVVAPQGTSAFQGIDADQCGDIDQAHSPLTQAASAPIGPVTISCVDNDHDGKVDIIHCETWDNNGNTTCNTANDVKAGTGAKCNCGTLPGACIAFPDDNPCTEDVCQGTCSNAPGQACLSNADCGGATCTNITVQHIANPGAACGDPSSTACDNPDTCGADGLCHSNVQPATTVCRASAGECDVAETCTGTSRDCPADGFQSSSTECRASAGVCDVAETCTGNSASCPADGFQPSSTVCRGSAGVCDVAETCTGSSASCPGDGFVPGGTECRASAGVCDVAESCTGNSAACPADAFQPSSTQCRGSAGECDVAENCTGSAATCPADAFQSSSTVCRPAAGDCDSPESCTGSAAGCPADVLKPSSTVCRTATGECDVAENCTGSSVSCPTDAHKPDDTACADTDDNSCTAAGCKAGECVQDDTPVGCDEICRTAGFWGTHAGTEKGGRDRNLTKQVIAAHGGCIQVCGETLTSAAFDSPVNNADSPEEALCINKVDSTVSQLARQLTAAALNCIVSNGNADCTNVSVGPEFAACNAACIAGGTAATVGSNTIDCVAAIDCFNNGGRYDEAAGTCQLGSCSVSGLPCGVGFALCASTESCVPTTGNCHDAPLENGVVQGLSCPGGCPASSSKACNGATQSTCTVTPPGESSCGAGLVSDSVETCS